MVDTPLSRPLSAALPAGSATSVMRLVSKALGAWRQRQQLQRLPAHLQRDLGLLESDIQRESMRPLWDVPQHWLR